MKFWSVVLGCAGLLAAVSLPAQTPVLGSIETPYANIPTTVHVAGGVYGPGAVAYGPAGTPLVISGSDFGDSGTVQFIAYKNGVVDTNNSPVRATVTLWTPTLLFLTVPSGALTGLVKVTSTGGTSNGLPFIVTSGSYSSSCPALPSQNQLQITTTALDDGTVGQAYSMSLSATGGAHAYTWAIASGSLPVGLTLNASTGVLSGTPTTSASQTDLTFQVTDSSSPHQVTTAVLSLTVNSSSSSASALIYSYCITASSGAGCASPTGGYDAVGNILAYTDSVTGTWSMTTPSGASGYDALNRLVAAQATAGSAYQGLQAAWSYDDFGNRTSESFGGSLNSGDTAPIPASSTIVPAANNRIQSIQSGSSSATLQYDASGDDTCDNYNSSTNTCAGNQYLYDGEGRICAVSSTSGMTQYLYDSDGTRVAKGTITSFSCDTTVNGFTPTKAYVLGPGDEQLTEMTSNGGAWQWAHTNVWAAGQLIATYSPDPDPAQQSAGILNFYLNDWLGTRRVTTDYQGNIEASCATLPYGNGESCAPIPTEHLFTGKERDAESGNDYFNARYYASSMGRFMSPDWAAKAMPVPYATFSNPQSLNLYSYMRNNPLGGSDADGHWPDFIGAAITVMNYIQSHPAVAAALAKIGGSFSGKVSAGVGVEESIGKSGLKGSVAASATGFAQFSSRGVTTGSDLKLGASLQIGSFKPSIGGTSETTSKENGTELAPPGKTETSTQTGIGSFSNDEKTFSIGDETGAGPDLGAELDVDKAQFSSGLSDLGCALSNSLSDLSRTLVTAGSQLFSPTPQPIPTENPVVPPKVTGQQ